MRLLTLIVSLLLTVTTLAQVPSRPEPQRLVNDFAGVLTEGTRESLERRLTAFDDSTSNQIVVVTVSDLGGLEIADFAQQLGESWGVGSKGTNNGIVILVKPKTEESKGNAFIATGYGLEGVLPDITCRHIVTDKMIPCFKVDDYTGGIIAGVEAVVEAANGEYHVEREEEVDDVYVYGVLGISVLLILLYLASRAYINRYKEAKTQREKITTTMTFIFVIASIYAFFANVIFSIISFFGGSSDKDSDSDSFGGFGGGSFGGGGGGGSW